MKILYGVQATGNGHISRARMMAKYFHQHNVDVTYLFSGRDKKQLFDMEVFGDYLYRRGLTFSTSNGSIDYLQSIIHNNIFQFLRDVYRLDLTSYDLIMTDFEPITAWAASKNKKISLGLGHQYAFGPNTPMKGESFFAKKIMQHFASTQESIGLHWSAYHENVFPPIIDVSIQRVSTDNSILVYLPFENQSHVTQLLAQFSDFKFIQYSPDLINEQQGNITLRKTCHSGFKADLKKARAVICNSGFELNSECIHLGLPVLTKPIKGQMEQTSNAFALEGLGFAQVIHHLDSVKIGQWLKKLPTNQAQQQQKLPDVAEEIVKWLLAGRPIPIKDLALQLW